MKSWLYHQKSACRSLYHLRRGAIGKCIFKKRLCLHTCGKFKSSQKEKGLKIHAWCIMSNHVHLIVSATQHNKLSDILRDLKKFTSTNIIKAITENTKESRKRKIFITDYLSRNPKSKLDIYYFNNKVINEYNIESFNKNPREWAKHDKYVESLNWYAKSNIHPSFGIDKAIKTSMQNDCGCNYRFDRSFIGNAIFFEITDDNESNSIWFLLPNGKILLYLMQGSKVLNYNYKEFGASAGLQYPCVVFDNQGGILTKK